MSEPARKKATYDDLYSVPDHMIGEIINGELVVTPRPTPKHITAATSLVIKIGGPFRFGDGGGPGGWRIVQEPELRLGEHILVPDLAGWRRERLPRLPKENWFEVPPDWICEVLSPGTARTDRVRKMPIYAEFGIPYLWLVDPIIKTLEVYKLESGRWFSLGVYSEDERVRAEPFQEVELDLSLIWD
ncbi:MAG: Uma2 family endonuclease [Deltaproteobacteria bacterium]|nr:Uma2 family endonuclease [Deltaproteobacteria bacterium]